MEDITFVEDVVATVATLDATEIAQQEHIRSNKKGCVARTRIVFADSSDDEVGEDGQKVGSSGPTVVVVERDYNFELDEEELVDEILTVDQETVDSFFEDANPIPSSRRPNDLTHSPQETSANTQGNDTASDRPRTARAATDASTAVATKKRFREDEHDDGDDEVVVEADGVVTAKEVVVRRRFQQQALTASGAEGDDAVDHDDDAVDTAAAPTLSTTVAREMDGYLLTLDETDLQDVFDGDDEEEDEEEDEEDDGLDDLVIVSAVEQLVQCCASEDQSDDERAAYAPFLEKARVALQELTDKVLTVAEFSEKMSNDVFRLHGTLRRLSRPPKDAPIIIDGVLMDM